MSSHRNIAIELENERLQTGEEIEAAFELRLQQARHEMLQSGALPEPPAPPPYTPADQIVQHLRQENQKLKEQNLDQKQTILEWKDCVGRLSWSILCLSAVIFLGLLLVFRSEVNIYKYPFWSPHVHILTLRRSLGF